MKRYLISLMATVLIVAIVVITWAPIAKSQVNCVFLCEQASDCYCAKLLGGSLRLTICETDAQCSFNQMYGWSECECFIDPLCKPWEKGLVVQTFPPVNLGCGVL